MTHGVRNVVVLFLLLGVLSAGCLRPTAPLPEGRNRCTSPYDGTWSGTLTCVHYRDGAGSRIREGISFDLTLNLSCSSLEGNVTALEVADMRASYESFLCTNGCRPNATARLGPPGSAENVLYLEFPNGVSLRLKAEISDDERQLRGGNGEFLAWNFGRPNQCPGPPGYGQCTPITASFTLTKQD